MYHKVDNQHPEALELESLSLKWLSQAMAYGGVHVVRVAKQGPGFLTTELIPSAPINAKAAFDFGRALAVTHAQGADFYGQAPYQFSGTGYMGRSKLDLLAKPDPGQTWGSFYAEHRILPNLPPARDNGSISAEGARVIDRLCERLRDGVFDAPEPALVQHPASRIHGDLWTGNVIWAPADQLRGYPDLTGCGPADIPAPAQDPHDHARVVGVLIDASSSGGHAETDLASLDVFGQPFLNEIYAGYNQVSALAKGWEDRINLHKLHMLAVHANLFGSSYGAATVERARAYL